MVERWRAIDGRIAALDTEFTEAARTDEAARRLTTVPGMGVLNATALVVAVGDGRTFARGRDLAAWLRLVPRQATDRRTTPPARDHEAGQQVSPQDACPGSPSRIAVLQRSGGHLGAWLRGLPSRGSGSDTAENWAQSRFAGTSRKTKCAQNIGHLMSRSIRLTSPGPVTDEVGFAKSRSQTRCRKRPKPSWHRPPRRSRAAALVIKASFAALRVLVTDATLQRLLHKGQQPCPPLMTMVAFAYLQHCRVRAGGKKEIDRGPQPTLPAIRRAITTALPPRPPERSPHCRIRHSPNAKVAPREEPAFCPRFHRSTIKLSRDRGGSKAYVNDISR